MFWSSEPGGDTGPKIPRVFGPYHFFNLFEGCVWLVFAALVIRRMMAGRPFQDRRGYALAFLTFGLTDFREAYALDSWPIWLKPGT